MTAVEGMSGAATLITAATGLVSLIVGAFAGAAVQKRRAAKLTIRDERTPRTLGDGTVPPGAAVVFGHGRAEDESAAIVMRIEPPGRTLSAFQQKVLIRRIQELGRTGDR